MFKCMSNYKNFIILLWQTEVEVLFEDGDSYVAAEEFRSSPVTAAVKKHNTFQVFTLSKTYCNKWNKIQPIIIKSQIDDNGRWIREQREQSSVTTEWYAYISRSPANEIRLSWPLDVTVAPDRLLCSLSPSVPYEDKTDDDLARYISGSI